MGAEPSLGERFKSLFQGNRLRPLERELITRTIVALDSDLKRGGTPDQIAAASSRQVVADGQPIIEEGSPGDALYILLDGAAEVQVGGRVVERLRQGEVFGEIALLTGEPRTATVYALGRCVVLRIPREQVDASLHRRLWDYAAERRFVNLTSNPEPDPGRRQTWFLQARHSVLRPGTWDTQAEHVFLYAGQLRRDGELLCAPCLFHGGRLEIVSPEVRVAILPPPMGADDRTEDTPAPTMPRLPR